MAFTPTTERDVWGYFTERFLAPELRNGQDLPTLLGVENQASGAVFGVVEEKKDSKQPTKGQFLHRGTTTTQAGRSATHTGPIGSSSLVDIDFDEKVETFSVRYNDAKTNFFTYDDNFDRQMRRAAQKINTGFRADIMTQLVAAVSQINNGDASLGSFNAVNNFFEIAAANTDVFFDYVKAMMRNNNYIAEDLAIILNTALQTKWNLYSNQGAGNDKNLQYQFDGFTPLWTNEQILGTYTNESLVMPKEAYAVLSWHPGQFTENKGESANDNVGMFGLIPNPEIPGMNLAVHMKRAIADTSGSAGDVQDIVLEVEVSDRRATVISPMSTATESPIFGVGIL